MIKQPGLRVLSGPRQAGINPGDAVCIPPGAMLFLSRTYRGAATYPAISWGFNVFTNGASWRFFDETWHGLYQNPQQRWVRVSEDRREINLAPWRVRLEDDVGPLGAVARYDDHLVVRPMNVDFVAGELCARWTGVEEGAGGEVVLTDCFVCEVGGDPADANVPCTSHRVIKSTRACGVRAGDLGDLDGRLDAGIARAIYDQLLVVPGAVVCFDGVVRARPDLGEKDLYNRPEVWFAEVTGKKKKPQEWPSASVDDVAAFMRSAYAMEWALEQQLMEECGVLLAQQKLTKP